MADINSLSFGCGNTLLASQLNIMADAIRSLITLVEDMGDQVGSYIPLSGSEKITGVLAPNTHEGYDLGKSTKRWGTVWASTGGFKTIDFYDLQTSNKLGTLEINVNNGRLQYDNKTLALLSDINNSERNVVTISEGSEINVLDCEILCSGIRAENSGSFETLTIGDDLNSQHLNFLENGEFPIYATLHYAINGHTRLNNGTIDTSDLSDNVFEISTQQLIPGTLNCIGAPIRVYTNNEGLYVDDKLITGLPTLENNKYLYVDNNGELKWANGTGTSGGGSIDWGTNSAPLGTLPHIILDGESKIHANELSGKMLSIYNKNTANDEYSGLWTITIQNNELCYGNFQITKNNGTELNTSNSQGVSYSSSDQGKYLKVKNDGTGTEWSDISLSDLSNTEIGGSNNALSNGLVLVYDLSSSKWKNTSLPANLPSVSGHSNEYLKVNNDGTLAEWVPVTPGSGIAGATIGETNLSINSSNNKIVIPIADNNGSYGVIRTGYTTSANDRNYKVLVDNSGNAYVNVPWVGGGSVTSITVGDGLEIGTGNNPITTSGTIKLPTFNNNNGSSNNSGTSVGPTSDVSTAGGTFTVPRITYDKYGRITNATEHTMTLPSGGTNSGVNSITGDAGDINFTITGDIYNNKLIKGEINERVVEKTNLNSNVGLEYLNKTSLTNLINALNNIENILIAKKLIDNNFVFWCAIKETTSIANGYFFYKGLINPTGSSGSSAKNIIFYKDSNGLLICATLYSTDYFACSYDVDGGPRTNNSINDWKINDSTDSKNGLLTTINDKINGGNGTYTWNSSNWIKTINASDISELNVTKYI